MYVWEQVDLYFISSTSTTIAVGVPVVHLVDLICRIYNVFEGSLVNKNMNKYMHIE